MAKVARTYFLCPHFDYPPSSIELGHIISSPSDPSDALNLDDVKPQIDSEVHTSYHTDVAINRSQFEDRKLGVLAKFLQVFGFGSDFEHRDGSEDVFKCDRLETIFFEPSPEYLKKAIQAEGVQMFLAGSRFMTPLYMVTGVKIARGGMSSSTKSDRGMAGVNVETYAGVPITVGPGIEVAASWSESKSFQSRSDFVFAFRLSKLKVRRVKGPHKSPNEISAGLRKRMTVDLEDAGIGGVRDVVVDESIDDNKELSPAVVMYSAESYAKGALF